MCNWPSTLFSHLKKVTHPLFPSILHAFFFLLTPKRNAFFVPPNMLYMPVLFQSLLHRFPRIRTIEIVGSRFLPPSPHLLNELIPDHSRYLLLCTALSQHTYAIHIRLLTLRLNLHSLTLPFDFLLRLEPPPPPLVLFPHATHSPKPKRFRGPLFVLALGHAAPPSCIKQCLPLYWRLWFMYCCAENNVSYHPTFFSLTHFVSDNQSTASPRYLAISCSHSKQHKLKTALQT